MNARDLPDVRDSESLFIEAERRFPSPESVQLYRDASESIDCVVDSYEEPVTSFAANLKYSYTRSLIRLLQQIEAKDICLLYEYIIFLLFQTEKEILQIKNREPSLLALLKESVIRFCKQS